MIPETLPNPTRDIVSPERLCDIARKWGVQPVLIGRLLKVAGMVPFDIQIFSGARTRAQQDELEQEGRPAAPWGLSTHADAHEDGCPRLATGADVQPVLGGIRINRPAIAQLGAAGVHAGLRWGGGSAVDDLGIPLDYWHFDLGPRASVP